MATQPGVWLAGQGDSVGRGMRKGPLRHGFLFGASGLPAPRAIRFPGDPGRAARSPREVWGSGARLLPKDGRSLPAWATYRKRPAKRRDRVPPRTRPAKRAGPTGRGRLPVRPAFLAGLPHGLVPVQGDECHPFPGCLLFSALFQALLVQGNLDFVPRNPGGLSASHVANARRGKRLLLESGRCIVPSRAVLGWRPPAPAENAWARWAVAPLDGSGSLNLPAPGAIRRPRARARPACSPRAGRGGGVRGPRRRGRSSRAGATPRRPPATRRDRVPPRTRPAKRAGPARRGPPGAPSAPGRPAPRPRSSTR